MSLKYEILNLEQQGTDLKSHMELISTFKDKLPNGRVPEKLKMVLEKMSDTRVSAKFPKCLMENQGLDSQQSCLQAKFQFLSMHLTQAAM